MSLIQNAVKSTSFCNSLCCLAFTTNALTIQALHAVIVKEVRVAEQLQVKELKTCRRIAVMACGLLDNMEKPVRFEDELLHGN